MAFQGMWIIPWLLVFYVDRSASFTVCNISDFTRLTGQHGNIQMPPKEGNTVANPKTSPTPTSEPNVTNVPTPYTYTIAWVLSAINNQSIDMRINHFDLGNGSNNEGCINKYLAVYSGGNCSLLFGPSCGNKMEVPRWIITENEKVLIVYQSDTINNIAGLEFDIYWQSATARHAYIAENFGNISSPTNYLSFYPHYTSYSWLISVNETFVVMLQFELFELEFSRSSCAYDSVSIYDGSSASSCILGRFCGIRPTFTLYSKGNEMYVQFITDSSINGKGFSAWFNGVNPQTYNILGRTPVMSDLQGMIQTASALPTYKTGTLSIFTWHIQVQYGYTVHMNWTFGGIELKNLLLIKEGSEELAPTRYKVSANITSSDYSNFQDFPQWLKNGLEMKTEPYDITGQWQANHKDIFLVYCTSLERSNQFTLDYHLSKVTKNKRQYCHGPGKYIVDVDLTTITEIGITSLLVPSNETSLCIWQFRSQPGYYVEIIIDSIDNLGFTGVSHGCEYGGFFLMDGNDANQTQNQFTVSKGFGPFCRSSSSINGVYKSLLGIKKFVSSTENLHILLYNVGGIGNLTIRAFVRATFCVGTSYGPNAFLPSPRYDIHVMWIFPTIQIKCLQIQLVLTPETKANIKIAVLIPNFRFQLPPWRPSIRFSKQFNQKPVSNMLDLDFLMQQEKSSHLLTILGKDGVAPSLEGVYILSLSIPGEFCSIFPHNGSVLRSSKCGLLRFPSNSAYFTVTLSTKLLSFFSMDNINAFDFKYFSLKLWKNGQDFVNCDHFEIVIDEMNRNDPFLSWWAQYKSNRIRKYSACDIGPQGIHIKTINGQKVQISMRCLPVCKHAKHIYMSYQVHSYKFPTLSQLCPNGFYLQNEKCYFFKSGYLHKTGWSWNDAKSYCLSKNATLLSITGLKEMEAIKHLLTTVWSPFLFIYPASPIHIGLYDDGKKVSGLA